MVVQTRSSRVKFTTPSFRDASIRTYKVYTPRITAAAATSARAEWAVVPDDSDVSYIAEAIMGLQDKKTRNNNTVITKHKCLNPMTPVTRYAYGIRVYNSAKTLHYRSAYVLYDDKTRLYTVYSIISNVFTTFSDGGVHQCGGGGGGENDDDDDTVHILPNPVHTVHAKYTTFVCDTVVNYLMTMIVPSEQYDYFIQDDILGIVASNEELAEAAFGPDSCYYDVAQLFQNDTSSCETTNGVKAFHLIPSREFWFDPTSTYMWQTYSATIANCALMIVSQSAASASA
jgi:hypothetical protein